MRPSRDSLFQNLNVISMSASRVVCVSQIGEQINITSNVCFPGRGTLRICVPGQGKHISLGICVFLTRKHTTSDTCFMGGGTYITRARDTCFLGRRTHITRDMCFSRREHISPGICVSQLNMCFSSGTYHQGYVFLGQGNTFHLWNVFPGQGNIYHK